MGLLNNIVNIIKGYDFEEPIIVKESNEASKQIIEMTRFRNELNTEGQELIDDEIRLIQAGIYGEDSILYELKNSHLPIVVLRDLQLSFKGLHAQIDFIILTPRGHLVIECKNMIGDIEVNSNGDFIRKYTYGRRTIKSGIYSPITQNRRHLDLLRDIFKDRQENFILRSILDNEFLKMFTPIVVVANSKSVLNIKYAKKEVKEKIIRLDQLNNKIRDILNNSDKMGYSCDELLKDANHIMDYHRVKPYDFREKYKNYIKSQNTEVVKEHETKVIVESVDESIESSPKYQALKKYRLEQSRKENVKPYFIFNNLQLEALVKSAPKNKKELLQINGFGSVKCEKYGVEILDIINRKFKI
ncbi:MAG TPA: HRDC domain-containing protein [Erysipelotrichaceae bacterium]|nr:HRDC domain-containing protein [Erysipelotrichaceae bacterium]